MTPEASELLKQTEADVCGAASKSGARPDFVLVRLRPDVHDAFMDQVHPFWSDLKEGDALVFAGFNVTRGPDSMAEAWRFWRVEDLPRRRATPIKEDRH